MAEVKTQDTQAAEQQAMSDILKSPEEGGAAQPSGAFGPGADVPDVLANNPAARQLLEESIAIRTGQNPNKQGATFTQPGFQEQPSVVTSDQARAQADQMAGQVDKAEAFLGGIEPASPDLSGFELSKPQTTVQPSGLTSQQEQFFDKQEQLTQNRFTSTEEAIRQQVENTVRETEIKQKQARGATNVQLARMGALNVSSAGIQYVNDLTNTHNQQIASIRMEGERLIQEARNARDAADLETLGMKVQALEANKRLIMDEQTAYLQNVQQMQQIVKFQRDSASATVDAMATAGLNVEDVPEQYLQNLDKAAGYVPGTSAGLLGTAKRAREIEDMMISIEKEAAQIALATDTANMLSSLPVGKSITVNGIEYTSINPGTVVSGTETDINGNVKLWSYNQDTGELLGIQDLGQIGKGEGWSYMNTENGEIIAVGPNGEKKFIYNPNLPSGGVANPTALQQDFPDGWKPTNADLEALGTYQIDPKTGGIQCGQFVRLISGYDGPSISDVAAKRALIDPKIGTAENPPQAGDVFIQGGGAYGHIGMVLGANLMEDGSYDLQIVDANSKLDGTIRYRTINSKSVEGFAREGWGLPAEYQFGTDADPDRPLTTSKPSEDEAVDATAMQWVRDILAGDVSISDVPSDTRNLVQFAKTSPEAQRLIQEKNIELAETMTADMNRIMELLEDPAIKNVVGGGTGRGALGVGKRKKDFIAAIEKLISDEALATLVDAKDRGATFGALSDTELQMIRAAASEIGAKAITDKDGNIKGFSGREDTFLKELESMLRTREQTYAKLYGREGEIPVVESSSGRVGFVTPEEFQQNPDLYKRRFDFTPIQRFQ